MLRLASWCAILLAFWAQNGRDVNLFNLGAAPSPFSSNVQKPSVFSSSLPQQGWLGNQPGMFGKVPLPVTDAYGNKYNNAQEAMRGVGAINARAGNMGIGGAFNLMGGNTGTPTGANNVNSAKLPLPTVGAPTATGTTKKPATTATKATTGTTGTTGNDLSAIFSKIDPNDPRSMALGIAAMLQSKSDEANNANLGRYNQGLELIRQGQGDQVGSLQGNFNDMLNAVQQRSNADYQREDLRRQAELGRAQQQMVGAGLNNSTVLPTLQGGVEDASALRQREISDQRLQQLLGLKTHYSDVLNNILGGNRAEALSWIGNRTDTQPNADMWMNLLSKLGATGTTANQQAQLPQYPQYQTPSIPYGGGGGGGNGAYRDRSLEQRFWNGVNQARQGAGPIDYGSYTPPGQSEAIRKQAQAANEEARRRAAARAGGTSSGSSSVPTTWNAGDWSNAGSWNQTPDATFGVATGNWEEWPGQKPTEPAAKLVGNQLWDASVAPSPAAPSGDAFGGQPSPVSYWSSDPFADEYA